MDASVQAIINRDPSLGSSVEEYIAPLEIKTGKSVGLMGHRAQTMLYTLLMEDRYGKWFMHSHERRSERNIGVPVPAGLLYYSQLDSILRVEARPNEIRALILARNELAHYLSRKRSLTKAKATPAALEGDIQDAVFLPSAIDHPRECGQCYAVDSCMLYRKVCQIDPLAG